MRAPGKQASILSPAVSPSPVLGPVALIPVKPSEVPLFDDDADTASLHFAAAQSLAYFQTLPSSQTFVLGPDIYSARDMADSMKELMNTLESATTGQAPSSLLSKGPAPAITSQGTGQDWRSTLRRDFNIYQSVGADSKRAVTFSCYYEPTMKARLARTPRFRYPIYGRPENLIDVDLGRFDARLQGMRIAGRREGKDLIPYYTRKEIHSEGIASGMPIVAWADDPAEIFFMQIEGSGWLDVGENQMLRLRYDGDNNRPYVSAGQDLIASGRVSPKAMSHEFFHSYLNGHPEQRQAVLDANPRYVFFRIDKSTMSAYAVGNIDGPLTPGRSVAIDPKMFPKGALAWIETERPVFNGNGKLKKTAPLHRFVLAQDEGGAIQGPGRVDYFVGSGPEAERLATHFWNKGKLYFLVRKLQGKGKN
jgi:membrane-bound lytic murein transglycosylase A